jgi:HEAT repeat protein
LTRSNSLKTAAWLLIVGLVCPATGLLTAAQDQAEDPLLQMVVELLGNEDRDMRALGLQQVREELPGEEATKKLVDVLTKLSPEVQPSLIEALGERGDATARPAILEMLKSEQPAVRTAALVALGGLGTPAEVPILAQKAAAGTDAEKDAARRGLISLRGEGVNAAVVAAMADADAALKVELIKALARRNATESLPKVLEAAKDPDPAVRSAGLDALRFLASADDAAAIVDVLKAAKQADQIQKAELALLSVANRDRQKTAEVAIAGLAGAEPASRVSLLRVLARSGGEKALAVVVEQSKADDDSVADEAVRMLSIWSDAAAAPHLLEIAKNSKNSRHQVLAIRGLVRLASPAEDKPADVKMATEAMNLAKRPAEKLLVIGMLGQTDSADSLTVVAVALDDPALVNEAGLAAVMISERIKGDGKQQVGATLKKVSEKVKDEKIRQRAAEALKSL